MLPTSLRQNSSASRCLSPGKADIMDAAAVAAASAWGSKRASHHDGSTARSSGARRRPAREAMTAMISAASMRTCRQQAKDMFPLDSCPMETCYRGPYGRHDHYLHYLGIVGA